MKLQDQVISFEQAKRLKELGVRAETFWEWLECAEFDEDGSKVIKWHPVLFYNHELDMFSAPGDYSHLMNDDGDFHETKGNAPAFTVAELGEMLPEYLSIDSYRMHVHSYKQEQNNSPALWTITMGKSSDKEVPDFDSHKEAEARAAMLIYLLENKLTTASECNKRLTT